MAEKVNCRRGKMGQVTIFIILALILVVVIVMIFVLIRGREVEVVPRVSDVENPQAYIESCVNEKVNEAAEILSSQGGWINPINYKTYNNEQVSYLCWTGNDTLTECRSTQSNLASHMEEEIKNYIIPYVENCFQELEKGLEEKNYVVEMSAREFEVELITKKILVNIEVDFKMSKRGDERVFEEFRTSLNYPLWDFAVHALNVVSDRADPEACLPLHDFDFQTYTWFYPLFQVWRDDASWDVKVYFVRYLDGREFKFAVRGCVNPPV